MSDRIVEPSSEQRQRWLESLGDLGLHARLVADLACLHTVEQLPAPEKAAPLDGWVRIAAWNLERGRDVDEALALMGRCAADVWLLSELDSGMARTGNRDVPADLAAGLGAAYAYGVEFIELGIGHEVERQQLSVVTGDAIENERGLHGNAILSRSHLSDATVVRVDAGGEWFAAESSEPRVGTRMAVVATVDIGGTPVDVASLHLENRADGETRARQLEVVLGWIDEHHPGRAAVVGGDLNTFGVGWADLADRGRVTELRALEPTRFSWPVGYEPIFEAASAHGYEWNSANVAAPTTRHGPDGLPDHVPIKLDWLLVRGLDARRPTVVPALDGRSRALSDHDVVAVSVRVPK